MTSYVEEPIRLCTLLYYNHELVHGGLFSLKLRLPGAQLPVWPPSCRKVTTYLLQNVLELGEQLRHKYG